MCYNFSFVAGKLMVFGVLLQNTGLGEKLNYQPLLCCMSVKQSWTNALAPLSLSSLSELLG